MMTHSVCKVTQHQTQWFLEDIVWQFMIYACFLIFCQDVMTSVSHIMNVQLQPTFCLATTNYSCTCSSSRGQRNNLKGRALFLTWSVFIVTVLQQNYPEPCAALSSAFGIDWYWLTFIMWEINEWQVVLLSVMQLLILHQCLNLIQRLTLSWSLYKSRDDGLLQCSDTFAVLWDAAHCIQAGLCVTFPPTWRFDKWPD